MWQGPRLDALISGVSGVLKKDPTEIAYILIFLKIPSIEGEMAEMSAASGYFDREP